MRSLGIKTFFFLNVIALSTWQLHKGVNIKNELKIYNFYNY